MDFDLKTEINGISIVGIDKGSQLFNAAGCNFYRATVFGDEYCARLDEEGFVASQKIETLIDSPGNDFYSHSGSDKTARLLAPVSLIKNNEGVPIGYLTEFFDFSKYLSIDCFFDPLKVENLPSPFLQALTYRLQIAVNLSKFVADLHQKDYYVVNWSAEKILIHLTTREVVFVDCESLSFPRNSDGRRNTTELTTGYIAPEFVKKTEAYDQFNQPQQDYFGLAVLLFQLLNNGIHPFHGYLAEDIKKGIRSLDDCVAAGLYPYSNTEHDKIKPLAGSVHQSLDEESRQLFDKAFFGDITKRPTPQDWLEHFEKILANKQLARCDKFPDDPLHIKFSQQPCAACIKLGMSAQAVAEDAIACNGFHIHLRTPTLAQQQPVPPPDFVADKLPPVAQASSGKNKVLVVLIILLFVGVGAWIVDTGSSGSSTTAPISTSQPSPQSSTSSNKPPVAKPNPGAAPGTAPKPPAHTSAPSASAPPSGGMQISADYASRIRSCIKPVIIYTPPVRSGPSAPNPTALFRISLGSPTNGSITGVSLVRSSGNAGFDKAVEAGIRQCGWLPLPAGSGFYSTPIEVPYRMYE